MFKGKNKWGRLLSVVMLVVMLSMVLVTPAMAGEYIEDNFEAVVEEDQVIDDDLFISAPTVRVLGTVKGDLFAAGQVVEINGYVEGNVFASGQVVSIGGKIDGALHVAGYAVQLTEEAIVARNTYFGGYSLVSEEGSLMGRSLYGGGYQLLLNGEVGRDVTVGVGAMQVNGFIGGDLDAEVGEPVGSPPPQFIGPPLPFGYSVPYVNPGFEVPAENVGGDIRHRVSYYDSTVNVDVDVPDVPRIGSGVWFVNQLRERTGELIALLIVGWLLLAFGYSWTEKVMAEIKGNFWPSFGWGTLVFLLYIPVVMVVGFLLVLLVLFLIMVTLGSMAGTAISVGTLSFFGFLTAFSVTASLVTKVVFSYLVGYELLKRFTSATLEGRWGKFWALLSGVVIYEMVRIIPFGGFLAAVVVVILGIGAIFAVTRGGYLARRAAAA